MVTTFNAKPLSQRRVASDPISDIAHVIPLPPDPDRNLYRRPPFGQRRPLKKDHSDQPGQKPQDPAHKVDDYA